MAQGFFSRFNRQPSADSPAGPPEEAVLATAEPATAVTEIVRGIAHRGLPLVPRKAAISLRLDADVLDWFRARGAGYQTRINAVLRAYMEASR